MKKIFTFFLTLVASASMFAAVVDGTCGENLQWSLNTKDSTLTITGSGAMDNYSDWNDTTKAPWNQYKLYIAKLNLPEGLTSIGSYAFQNCDNLDSIKVPSTVTRYGSYCFYDCGKLASINIPEGVDTIPHGFLNWCTHLTSIEIPNSVSFIDEYSFSNCFRINSVVIGSGILKIGESAFSNCTAVTRLTVAATTPPAGGASCGINAANCKLYVPEESIETYQSAIWWEDFKEILAIGTPDPVYEIEVQVVFPKGAPDAGIEIYGDFNEGQPVAMNYYAQGDIWWAVINATEEQTFNFREVGNPDNFIIYQENSAWYIFPDIKVGEWMQEQEGEYYISIDFTRLTSKWTVEYNCGDNLKWSVKDGVLTITGSGDMWDYDVVDAPWGLNITSVVFPDGITSIGAYAFWNCAELNEITIPASIKKVGLGAFQGCAKLTSVIWNAIDCPTIEEGENVYPPFYAIRDQITSFVIGKSVKKVPSYLCLQCTNITSIELPAGITEFGTGAFAGCSGLTSVYNYAGTPQTINNSVFNGVNKNACTLYVPEPSVEAYKAANFWKEFFKIEGVHVEAIDQVGAILKPGNKVLRNGQLLIISGDKTYTVTGQEVK